MINIPFQQHRERHVWQQCECKYFKIVSIEWGNVGFIFQDYLSDTESSEDEIEPKLKYVRLLNDIPSILLKSCATSIAVHPKVTICDN